MSEEEVPGEAASTALPEPAQPAAEAVVPLEPTASTPGAAASGSKRSVGLGRFAVPIIAALILAVGLTSAWWWPLVRPVTDRHAGAVPVVPAPPAPADTPATAPAPADIARLTARVDRLDDAMGALQDGASNAGVKADLDALDRRVSELGHRLDTVNQQPGASPQQLASLADTVTALRDQVDAVSTQLQQRQTLNQDQIARFLAAMQLASAIAAAEPYGPALQVFEKLGIDPALSAPLEILTRHAEGAVASRAKLEWELQQMPARFADDTPEEDSGGFWHRTLLRLKRLVHIHRAEAPGSNTPATVVDAAETELAGGDLGAAIQSVQTLQGHAAQIAAPWLEEARDRLQIEQAAQALQTSATAGLTSAAEGER